MAHNPGLDRDSDTVVAEQVRLDTEDNSEPLSEPGKLADRVEGGIDPVAPENEGARGQRRSQDTGPHPMSAPKDETSRFLRLMTPKRCRWDPTAPPGLSMPMAILYALVSILSCNRWGSRANRTPDKHLHCCQSVLLSTHPEQDGRGVRRLV